MSDHRFGPYCPTSLITTSSSSFDHGPLVAAVLVRFFPDLSPSVSSREPSSSSSRWEGSSGISCLPAMPLPRDPLPRRVQLWSATGRVLGARPL